MRSHADGVAAAPAVNAFCKTQQLTFAGIRLGYDCVMDDALFVSRRY